MLRGVLVKCGKHAQRVKHTETRTTVTIAGRARNRHRQIVLARKGLAIRLTSGATTTLLRYDLTDEAMSARIRTLMLELFG